MSSVEAALISSDHLRNWDGKGREQVTEELASLSLETQRIPDPYIFSITPTGELYSPVAYCRVKDVVIRDNYVGRLEYEALEKIERWAATSQEGVIAWVSPQDPTFYPLDSKIVISEIQKRDGKKVLFNRAIVLDIDQERCFKFAQDLANYSTNRPLLSSIDQIRSTPIMLNTQGIHWSYILEELIPDLSLQNVREGKDLEVKARVLVEAEKIYEQLFAENGEVDMEEVILAMRRRALIGPYSFSCPVAFGQSAFGFFVENSLFPSFPCPNRDCGKPIPSSRGLTTCPHCGARKEDYKSGCD